MGNYGWRKRSRDTIVRQRRAGRANTRQSSETDDLFPSSSLGGINGGSDPSRTGEINESGTHGTQDLAPSISGCGTCHHPRRRWLSGPNRFPLSEPTFTGNSRSSPADLLTSQGDAFDWVASLGDVEEAIYPPHLSQISNFQSVRLYYENQDSNSNNSHLSNSTLSTIFLRQVSIPFNQPRERFFKWWFIQLGLFNRWSR